jgi:hypothetical protein
MHAPPEHEEIGNVLPADDFTTSLSLHVIGSNSTLKTGSDMFSAVPLSSVPASLHALPPLNDIIHACWQQRDLRRPAAADVFTQLTALLQRALVMEEDTDTHV